MSIKFITILLFIQVLFCQAFISHAQRGVKIKPESAKPDVSLYDESLASERCEARIKKFINDYCFDRNNRLIIYYAGHGHTLDSVGDNRKLGYIIPSDTPLADKDPLGFRQKAVSMYKIQTFAREIQAKHALFLFDSCFSGKLFTLRNTRTIPPFIFDKINYPLRQFITAGDETQTVPDESVFRKSFVRGL